MRQPGNSVHFFQDLGSRVEDRWRARNYDEGELPELAYQALRETPSDEYVQPMDIVRHVFDSRQLPRQLDMMSVFGRPPITLYRGKNLVVDVYFWLDGTTAIHQHGFSGAFQVLSGSSVHGVYRWREERRVNEHLLLGQVEFQQMELLQRGETRRILPGPAYIHSLFHLDRPSVSLVIRSVRDFGMGLQYKYMPPFVALDDSYQFKEEYTTKLLQFVRLLHEMDSPEKDSILTQTLATSDLHLCFLILDQCLTLRGSVEAVEPLLEAAKGHHGEVIDERFRPVLARKVREMKLIDRRAHIKDADHRFFLAVLLNVTSREAAFQLVRSRYPGKEPVDMIMEWMEALTQPGDGEGASSAKGGFGVPMGEDTLLVFRCMLEKPSFEHLLSRLRAEGYDEDDLEQQKLQLKALYEAVRTSDYFAPLFAES